MIRDEFLWVENYRPRVLNDVILPQELKKTFEAFISKGEISNMILSGGPGVGKTTVARAVLEELSLIHI